METHFTADCRNLIRHEIDSAHGNEVFFIGRTDIEGRVIEVETIARGTKTAVPAIIGCGETPVPDCNTIKLDPSDMLLLCSDGLTDLLSDTEIEAFLANTSFSFESLPGKLIDAANEKGGHDNVSIILIRCDK